MTFADAVLSDPRRRNLAILAAATFVMVVLAVLAVHYDAAATAPHYTPETFLPHFASRVDDAAHIRIETAKGSLDVVRRNGNRWVVPARNDYPAALDEIRETLVGLATLETIEPKTANPAWFHYVDLDAPPKGNGVHVEVWDAQGRNMASVIFGKSEDIGDPGGATGLFARKTGQDRSYLVRSDFQPKTAQSDWLNKTVVSIDSARIQETDVTPASGGAYVVRREKPADADFTLTPLPHGREVSNPAAPDGVADAIADFSFDDVVPASRFDFSKATKLVTRTFDGVSVTANAIQEGSAVWVTLSAEAAAGNANAKSEVTQINSHAAGWAYKLPSYKGQLFMTTLESLLKPVTAPAKTAR